MKKSNRKLPLKPDKSKVEFSGTICPRGSNEESTFYGDTDHRDTQRKLMPGIAVARKTPLLLSGFHTSFDCVGLDHGAAGVVIIK